MSEFTSPNFKNPPVIEVVLGVQFEQLHGFPITAIGELHKVYEKKYPVVQEHPLLEPKFENLNVDTFMPQHLTINLMDPVVIPRVWFLSEHGGELIQFQRDRFIYNWRRDEPSTETPYPRYEAIRGEFQERYGEFLSFLREKKLPMPQINQLEVTYVNLIACEDNDFSKAMHEVFRIWGSEPKNSPLGEPENQKFFISYLIHQEDQMVGRMTVSTNTLMRSDKKKFLQVNVTARGRPKDTSEAGILEFMNLCRCKIVSGFEYLTTDKMHKIWSKE